MDWGSDGMRLAVLGSGSSGNVVVVGDPSRGPVLKVTDNQLAIDSSLRLEEAPLVSATAP